MKNNEEIYIVTDGCMWEQNKKNSTYHPHAIEVCNSRTGQIQYIKSGSRISFIQGEITDLRTQEAYNEATTEMCDNGENELQGKLRKKTSRKKVK